MFAKDHVAQGRQWFVALLKSMLGTPLTDLVFRGGNYDGCHKRRSMHASCLFYVAFLAK